MWYVSNFRLVCKKIVQIPHIIDNHHVHSLLLYFLSYLIFLIIRSILVRWSTHAQGNSDGPDTSLVITFAMQAVLGAFSPIGVIGRKVGGGGFGNGAIGTEIGR